MAWINITLIMSAPSMLPPEYMPMKALRLCCAINESGRITEIDAWEPMRSSGSHNNCLMRLTASNDTFGLVGNFSDCLQFKIFCRVTCRYKHTRKDGEG